ncbi:MAG: cell division protein ZapB [Patescibacteria group bacterium]|nr:cell division protein ZapB [Patescibacteria group bacterium]
MNRNQVIGGVIAILVIIFLLLAITFGWFKTKIEPCPPPSDTTVIVGTPVSSDSLIRMHEAIARLQAEKACQDKLEQKNAELTAENNRLKEENSKKRSTPSSTSKSTTKASGSQKTTIVEQQPDKQDVTNIYRPTAPGAQEFCVSVRTDLNGRRDSGSFWPHLEGNPPTGAVQEAVLNSDGTGWNVKLPPVDKIGGLYGWSDNLRVIFVKAEILDKFGPTNVSMSGGMNSWPKIWPMAQKENIDGVYYYVTHY